MSTFSKLSNKEAKKLEKIAHILKSVAHLVRLGIIHLLESSSDLSVTEICEYLGTEQSLTSHHLQQLKLKGLIAARREGRNIYYFLKEKDVSLIIECLENCNCNM